MNIVLGVAPHAKSNEAVFKMYTFEASPTCPSVPGCGTTRVGLVMPNTEPHPSPHAQGGLPRGMCHMIVRFRAIRRRRLPQC